MARPSLWHFFPLFLNVFLLLAGCAPLPTAVHHLPPPQVLRLPRPTASPVSALLSPSLPSPTPAIEPYPAEYADLYSLAAQAYGEERLIRWISIPALNVESLVVPVGWHVQRDLAGKERIEWDSPGPFVGWALQSALPGEGRPVLLYGHNNLYGSIFRHLYRLQRGDEILLHTSGTLWTYRVEQVRRLPLDEQPSLPQIQGNVLVLLSCYPPSGNTWRVLVTAFPQTP